MSILIKGMVMPKDKGIIITIYPDGYVDKMADFFGGKTEQFSAVEVKTPHVLDKIRAEIDDYLYNNDFGTDYRVDIANIIDKYRI